VKIVRGSLISGLFLLVVASLVFSLEFPIEGLGSRYASINMIDFVILLIVLVFVIDNFARNTWDLRLTLPRVTAFLAVVSGWIVVTLFVASLRSPLSILASVLWTLKWFEVILLFVLAQHYLDYRTARRVISGFFIAGTGLVIVSILLFQIFNIRRIRIFFDNPNTLSVFFNFLIFLGLAFAIDRKYFPRALSIGAVLLAGLALLFTGSRSGILGFGVGIFALVVLTRDRLPRYGLVYLGLGGVGLALSAPFVLPEDLWVRLTNWIQFENGTVTLADTIAARSFRTRLELIDRGIELFLQQPIFGYGWYASPSRVGFLDVHFTTVLVELGVVGFLLIFVLYAIVFRAWLNIRRHDILGTAGAAWFVSILAQSIGGNFLRTPQVLFILLVFLAAGTAVAQEQSSESRNIQSNRGDVS